MARMILPVKYISIPPQKRTGLLIEVLFWVYFFYVYLSEIYSFSVNDLGFLLLVATSGAVLFTIYPFRILESPSFMTIGVFTGYILLVLLVGHSDLSTSMIERFLPPLLYTICFSYLIKRPGFVRRVIVAMTSLGLLAFSSAEVNEYDRVVAGGGGTLSNANSFAAWLGFCAVCLASWGFHTRSIVMRIILWFLMFCMLLMGGLTVSRGALLTVGISLVVLVVFDIARSVTAKELVVTVVLLGIGIFFMTLTPTFDTIVDSYTNRIDRQSGREELWPAAIEMIKDSPLLGHGEEGMSVAAFFRVQNAHNPFLTMALLSGVFGTVLLLFVYVFAGIKMEKDKPIDGVLWLPALWVYVFVIINFTNWYFVKHWAIFMVVLALDYKATQPIAQSEVLELPDETLSSEVRRRIRRKSVQLENKVAT